MQKNKRIEYTNATIQYLHRMKLNKKTNVDNFQNNY